VKRFLFIRAANFFFVSSILIISIV